MIEQMKIDETISREKKVKIELFNDNFQNFKKYGIRCAKGTYHKSSGVYQTCYLRMAEWEVTGDAGSKTDRR